MYVNYEGFGQAIERNEGLIDVVDVSLPDSDGYLRMAQQMDRFNELSENELDKLSKIARSMVIGEDLVDSLVRISGSTCMVSSTSNSKMRPRDKQLLHVLYGIDDGEPKTLREAGASFGLSTERVRQIRARKAVLMWSWIMRAIPNNPPLPPTPS